MTIDERCWYVGYTKPYMERMALQRLESLGIESYLPLRHEIHKWSDRSKRVDRVLVPRMVFVRCLNMERVRIQQLNPYIRAWMSDHKGPYSPAMVPDCDMERFRQMVDCTNGNVRIESAVFAPGDKVRVIAGPLKGMECEMVQASGRYSLCVRIPILGAALTQIEASEVVKIQ